MHLLTPTYALFPEIAGHYTETRLLPAHEFVFDLSALTIPDGTTPAVLVHPNDPNGGVFDTAFVCERRADPSYGIGLIPMFGIGLHSFIDGIVYSITFTVSFFTGALAASGMVLHDFPEGIITHLLLLRGGFRDKTSLLPAFLAASLSTPLGMPVSWPYISQIDQPLLGGLLPLSAGALVYVGATHLLPQAEREHRKYSLCAPRCRHPGSGPHRAVQVKEEAMKRSRSRRCARRSGAAFINKRIASARCAKR